MKRSSELKRRAREEEKRRNEKQRRRENEWHRRVTCSGQDGIGIGADEAV